MLWSTAPSFLSRSWMYSLSGRMALMCGHDSVPSATKAAMKANRPAPKTSANAGDTVTRKLAIYGEMPVPKDHEKLNALVSLFSCAPSAPRVIQASTCGHSMLMKKPYSTRNVKTIGIESLQVTRTMESPMPRSEMHTTTYGLKR